MQLREQIAKLDQVAAKLKEEDDEIFSKIVSSIQEKDGDRAKVLASELSVMVKMGVMLTEAKLALEQLTLRLNTVTDMGDVAEAAAPSLNVIKNLTPGLASIVPESQSEMGKISELLSGALTETGQTSTDQPSFETSDDATDSIIEEAAIVQQPKFPNVPESSHEMEAETA